MKRKQQGFTLVEIAIVLVIIGLLLGGILKGQELINSARVRNLADSNTGIQAAYYGFIDRYRAVPGDMQQAGAQAAIGVAITGGGDGNGRLDSPAGAGQWTEPNALWEHLSKAGFITGSYAGTAATQPTTTNNLAPLNPFNGLMLLSRHNQYLGTASVSLNLILGRNIPVDVARELDLKVDDAATNTGSMRLTTTGGALFSTVGDRDTTTDCNNAGQYNIAADGQDCNLVFLY